MGFIESLNKFGRKIPLTKTELYLKIEKTKVSLEAMGLKVKIKDEFDLFDYEVIYNGLMNQNYIENAYDMFLNEHYDLLDYLNYDERRKMFDSDISSFLQTAPHFLDQESQSQIYIPYLEPFINQRYTDDYQIMMLKQHRDYIKNYKVEQKACIQMYGKGIFRTDFSSLENVYEDDRHICLYYDPLKTIYIFKKESDELLNKVIIQDSVSHGDISVDDVKTIAYDIETYLYKECLDLLKEKELICEKTYQKVLKKYR